MAISDMKGTVTTTGMMNQNQQMPKGKVDPKLPKPVVAKPKAQPKPEPTPEQNLEKELLSKFPKDECKTLKLNNIASPLFISLLKIFLSSIIGKLINSSFLSYHDLLLDHFVGLISFGKL